MQQRYYDPVVGRFYSNDPVGFTGNPHSFNRYAYVDNNPYKYTDPDGRIGKLINAGVKLVKNGGNPKAAGKEFVQDIIDSGAILADPNASLLDKAEAVFNLVSPVGTNDLPAGTNKIFRGGSGTANNLTPRPEDLEGLSANLNPMKGKNQVIDTTKLDKLCAVCDNPQTGHVSIRPKDMSQMQGWIDSRGTDTVHPLTEELMNAVVDQVKK